MEKACGKKNLSTERVKYELSNITENLKPSGPTAVYAIKERIQQKLLHLMNSAAISDDLTALKQLDKSLNSA